MLGRASTILLSVALVALLICLGSVWFGDRPPLVEKLLAALYWGVFPFATLAGLAGTLLSLRTDRSPARYIRLGISAVLVLFLVQWFRIS